MPLKQQTLFRVVQEPKLVTMPPSLASLLRQHFIGRPFRQNNEPPPLRVCVWVGGGARQWICTISCGFNSSRREVCMCVIKAPCSSCVFGLVQFSQLPIHSEPSMQTSKQKKNYRKHSTFQCAIKRPIETLKNQVMASEIWKRLK